MTKVCIEIISLFVGKRKTCSLLLLLEMFQLKEKFYLWNVMLHKCGPYLTALYLVPYCCVIDIRM